MCIKHTNEQITNLFANEEEYYQRNGKETEFQLKLWLFFFFRRRDMYRDETEANRSYLFEKNKSFEL